MYQILVADDHPLFREAIAQVIHDGFPGTHLHEAHDFDSTLAAVAEHDELDLLLLDLNMPGMNGMSGLIRLRNQHPTLPAVVVSAEEDKHVILQSVTCGAVGFITKSTPRKQIVAAIQQVLDGAVYLPSDIVRAGASAPPERNSNGSRIYPDQLDTLTRKQMQVFEKMAHGSSNKVIAYDLNITESTVKAHVSAILRKLGATNRVQAVIAARDIDFSAYLRRPAARALD
ncbi:response regulator [Isoalcanivorax beigongshangi]|uniref:Response regulator n=1 Tax=Isoalcanivorax beigongshangi TaxID=3238810 RepID=A0ABV4AJN5_9GAMM